MNYQEPLKSILQEAGAFLMQHFRSVMTVSVKEDGSIVTEIDIANELFLQEKLKALFPEAVFHGEESGKEMLDAPYVWVVDPLDGTRNYVHGLPHFCISVALVYQGTPVVGAVFAPVTKDYFYAQTGTGMWVNGMQVHHQEDTAYDLRGILMAGDIDKLAKIKNRLKKPSGAITSMRKSGAAALDLAYVASGYIDVAAYGPMKWWDVAAGVIMVQEAGGVVVDLAGKPYFQGAASLVAGKKDLLLSFLPNNAAEI